MYLHSLTCVSFQTYKVMRAAGLTLDGLNSGRGPNHRRAPNPRCNPRSGVHGTYATACWTYRLVIDIQLTNKYARPLLFIVLLWFVTRVNLMYLYSHTTVVVIGHCRTV